MQNLKRVLVLCAAFMLTWTLAATVNLIPAEQWTISTNGKTDKAVVEVAKELQSLLAERIGKKIVIHTEKGAVKGPVILLGEFDPQLGPDSFRIVRNGDVIRIIGNNPLGMVYGVYEFTQRYCDVWHVAPNAIYAPKGKALCFGEMDLTMHPTVPWREIYHTGFLWRSDKVRNEWKVYDLRNRARITSYTSPIFAPYVNRNSKVSGSTGRHCHSFYDYVPPAKYGKTHPEYYSMNKYGARDMKENAGGQLCLSNPDVEKIVYEHLMTAIAKDRKEFPDNYPFIYDFTQMDNSNILCCCPNCQEIIKQYGGKDSGLLIWFVNKVIRKVNKTYPDVILRTFAYVNTEDIPAGIKPDDNILIELCDLYSKSSHILPLTHPANKERADIIRSWTKEAKRIQIWDYILQSGTIPMTPADAIQEDVKFFKSCNVAGIFMETGENMGCEASFVHLKNFLLAQFYFNADQDLEKLIDVFCRGYYGDAHAKMKEYLNFLRSEQKKHPTTDMSSWHERNMAHINMDFLRKGKAMVQEAMKINKDPVVELHILNELNVLDTCLTNLMAAYPKMAAERNALLQQLLKNRIRYVEAQEICHKPKYDEVIKKIRLPIEESMLVFTDIPEELKKLPAGKIKFLGSSRITTGNHAKWAADPESPMKKAVFWKHASAQKFEKTIGLGVYDFQWKKYFKNCRITAPSDEKYHWYKLFTSSIGPNSRIWALDWTIGVSLKGFFVVSDGLTGDSDPNKYEFWVSMKCQGPAYNPESTKENAIVIDRAMMIPVK